MLKLCPEGKCEQFFLRSICDYIWNKGKIIVFCNNAHVESIDRYHFEPTNKTNKFMKEQLFVTKNIYFLPILQYFGFLN